MLLCFTPAQCVFLYLSVFHGGTVQCVSIYGRTISPHTSAETRLTAQGRTFPHHGSWFWTNWPRTVGPWTVGPGQSDPGQSGPGHLGRDSWTPYSWATYGWAPYSWAPYSWAPVSWAPDSLAPDNHDQFSISSEHHRLKP